MATFDSYADCYAAGYALATAQGLSPKLCSAVEARIVGYFPKLEGHLRQGRHLLVSLLPSSDLDDYRALMQAQGGHVDLTLTEEQRQAAGLPHVFEFAYNHTTLQVLKSDRTATYQQIGVPDASDVDSIVRLEQALGDDVWQHHEFARLNGTVVSFSLPIVWFTTEARLREIDAICESRGFPVYDAHCFHVEGGGLKNADYRHLAWKKRMDPKGLLNPGKSRVWDDIRHLEPDEIDALAGRTP